MGKLYIVGTPIGNLGDMTFRAVETLKTVDFICAEDTRVTSKLLSHFEIRKPLVSCHEHNIRQVGEGICERILAGENAAAVTDAGMPCISDPGEELVRMCCERGISVEVVPGPTAAMSALAVSGLPTGRFQFEGFLPTDKKPRLERLAAVKDSTPTLIFYEAPHKLRRTLDDLHSFLGDRHISLCRELTKIHEEVQRVTLSEACAYYAEHEPRGEYVLIVEGAAEKASAETIEEAFAQVEALVAKGVRGADACKQIAKATGFSKGELYSMLLDKNTV
ncbi:MAG: 16S rRNA (cytidine(1402)-2'-O)-methyltransferase [Ruminococcus sp.]|nr:16S rRNA (cytidine(1402)-2'-O)-methyltransferase [Ruminococcus sp.]